jgi:hypothetical protein
MEKLKIILPFLLILFLASILWPGIAFMAGERLPTHNNQLEGARILEYRRNIIRNFPALDYDVILAGSSRTMSDFSPRVIRSSLARWLSRDVTVCNAGNVASKMSEFDALLNKGCRARCVVLEFSPHMFGDAEPAKNDFPVFQRWRLNTKIFELRVSGYFRRFLGMGNLVAAPQIIVPRVAEGVKRAGFSFKLVYMSLFGTQGYFEQQQDDGQVYYRVFLKDRADSEFYRSIYGARIEQNVGRQQHPNKNEWRSFVDIVNKCRERKIRLILVRPPLSAGMYRKENSMQSEVISRVRSYARLNKIPYMDMNPNTYSLADDSHVDWFDTEAASLELAKSLKNILK